uniref:Uncharacterized protein n=1 Tax=viral metagenome TaxID=1070528 RepID=A0A6M3X655_9ZZZZ
MPKHKEKFNNANFEEREFDESTSLDKLQVLARAIRSSRLDSGEFDALVKFVSGKSLDPEEQKAFRESLKKTLSWVFKQIKMEEQADPIRKIMTSVLSVQIQDYIYGVRLNAGPVGKELRRERKDKTGIAKDRATRVTGLRRAEQAYEYLFVDSKESGEYVFGFRFICSFLGFDYVRLRAAILTRVDNEGWLDLSDFVNTS